MKKIILITNVMTPYRKPLYDEIYERCLKLNIQFKVYCLFETKNWKYNDLKNNYTELLSGKLFRIYGLEIPFNFEIRKKLKYEKPDILIIAGSWMSFTNYLINLKKYKIVFWSESNLLGIKRINGIKERIWSFFRTKFYRKVNYFLVPGKNAEETVLKWRNLSNRPKFISFPNTIEEISFTHLEKEKYDERTKIFLITARLVKVKGIIEFVENVKDIIKNEKIKILIAGEGELKDKIESKIKEYGLENKIILLGYIDPKLLRDYYLKADFFVLPSLYDPSPLSVIEALYYELPILISNKLGNMPEVFNNNGAVFDPFDKSDLEQKIIKLLTWDEKDYNEAREKSKKIYLEKFNKKRIITVFLDEILKILFS